MNKRQYLKCLARDYHVDAIKDCPNYGYSCEDECDGCNYPVIRRFRRQLKHEGIPVAGWALSEVPAPGVYIFVWRKKNKEVTFYPNAKEGEQFCVYNFDTTNDDCVPNIRAALSHPNQERWNREQAHRPLNERKALAKRARYLWSPSKGSYRKFKKYGGKRL